MIEMLYCGGTENNGLEKFKMTVFQTLGVNIINGFINA